MEDIVFSAQHAAPTPLEKPPDGGDSSPPRTDLIAFAKVSFRDKVVGDRPIPPPMGKRDLISQKLLWINHDGGNPLLPMVYLNDKVFDELCQPWKDARVVKLLDKTVGYKVMKDQLQKVWKPQRGLDILDVDNGYYMVKFDL